VDLIAFNPVHWDLRNELPRRRETSRLTRM